MANPRDGIKAINQKYGELLDAHQSLDHAIRLGQKYNPLGSLTEILAGVTHGLPAYAAMKAGRSTAGMTVAAQATRNLADLSELLRKSATGYAVSSPYDEHPAVQAAEKANPKMFAPRMTPEQAALQARLAAKLRK